MNWHEIHIKIGSLGPKWCVFNKFESNRQFLAKIKIFDFFAFLAIFFANSSKMADLADSAGRLADVAGLKKTGLNFSLQKNLQSSRNSW